QYFVVRSFTHFRNVLSLPTRRSSDLSLGYLPAPFTLRRGIEQLEPGTWRLLRPGAAMRSGRYVPPLAPRPPFREGSVEALAAARPEEHTSELQSRENLVCRLRLEKKK